eukprot:8857194-Ditylum_brightwellii.AAC.1
MKQKSASSNAVYHHSGYGPTFGGNHDMRIIDNANSSAGSYTNVGGVYECPPGQTPTTFLTGS